MAPPLDKDLFRNREWATLIGDTASSPGGQMKDRTRYWIFHWVRVVLWPVPVLTLLKVWRAANRPVVARD